MSNGRLALVRHGQSEWNASNQFTGWVSVTLTDRGHAGAIRADELLIETDLRSQVLHTSLLRRAINTAYIALDAADLLWIPVIRDWRLDECHYSVLQDLNKAETKERYGEGQFMSQRCSYDTPPSELSDGSEFSQANNSRYVNLDEISHMECLLDVVKRFIPYFEEEVLPRLGADETVVVAAHGNPLCILVKHLDNTSDEDTTTLNIPTGIPLAYDFDAEDKVLNPGGTYLGSETAAAGAATIAAQDNK